jgi:diacylglycerol kinase (ATP)
LIKHRLPFFIQSTLSIAFALNGIRLLISKEDNTKLHVLFGNIISILGAHFELSAKEWLIQILTLPGVLSLEVFDTAIEKLANFIHFEYHEKIKIIKI